MKQAFVHTDTPHPDKITEIENWTKYGGPVDRDLYRKPYGGIWTSPVDAEYGWEQFCDDTDRLYDTTDLYYLTPVESANVYTIDTVDDLVALIDDHDRDNMNGYIDFESAFTEYDGIHLSDEGETATRHGNPNLRGWDVASVVWDGWHFEESPESIKSIATHY